MIELAEEAPKLCLFGLIRLDPNLCESVENPELLFTQSLVDDQGIGVFAKSRDLGDYRSGMPRSQIRGREDDVWFFVIRHGGEPSTECRGLLLSKLR